MKEEWADIGETGYQVSNHGRVKSKFRVIQRTDNKVYTNKERILRPAIDGSGYHRCALMINGKLTTFKVHRLVAKYFCDKRENCEDVNHKDGNKINNNYSNLEWVSKSENVLHALRTGLYVPRKGSMVHNSLIDEMEALTIKTLLMSGLGPSWISKKMGVSVNITKDISRGKTWNHLF